MSSNTRRSASPGLALGLLSALELVSPAAAQDPPGVPRLSAGQVITLPADPAVARKLAAVPDYARVGKWVEATALLQSVLSAPEDSFLSVPAKGGGEEAARLVSARAEAARMITSLPGPGREFYETTYGAAARDLLARGGGPDVLAEVVRLYAPTKAGAEALEALGTHHLDRGRAALAARCFARRLRHPDFKPSAALLFKAALADRRAGDPASAERTWKRLAAAAPAGLRLGGRQVSLDELRAVLARAGAADTPADDWSMFRGNATRSAKGHAGLPLWDPKWKRPTAEVEETRDWLRRAVGRSDRPVLPSFFPLLVSGRVIYRTHRGVSAADLRGGRLLWEAPFFGSLESLASDGNSYAHLSAWAYSHLQSEPHALCENSVIGTLSADRDLVYAVEDVPFPPVVRNYGTLRGRQGMGLVLALAPNLTDAVYHSRLVAIDLKSGKVVWERGGRAARRGAGGLKDTFFLGPPLPLNGKLYVLTERDQAIRLVCLGRERGEVLWSQAIAMPANRMVLDPARRLHAAPLAHAGGVLVCPTNAGAVVALDLSTRELLWAYVYGKPPPPPPEDDDLWRGRRRRRSSRPLPPPPLTAHWKAAAPVIHQGKVLLTAPDEASLHCLDLCTGRPLWTAEKAEADLYLAGARDGKVLLVGDGSCRCLRLDDGKEVWDLATGRPSGQGTFGDGVYYLPLRADAEDNGPAVLAIDLATGTIKARVGAGGDPPGNLLFHGESVLSQTAGVLAAYPLKAGRE